MKDVLARPTRFVYLMIFFRCFLALVVSFLLFHSASAETTPSSKNTPKPQTGKEKVINDTKGLQLEEQTRQDVEWLVLKWTNEERRKRKLPALTTSLLLGKLGQVHSLNQAKADLMAHDSDKFPKGWQTFGERMKKLRYVGPVTYAENVFWTNQPLPLSSSGRSDYARKMVQAWMSSEGHRKNILHPKFSRMGIGFCQGYVTQLFASQEPKN
ncbi:MAG: CAP domain-containing protein [Deltaproteobacteria bacterium]|nr:CAP domain-containing protein [Deltaproteobacteria bacterium]